MWVYVLERISDSAQWHKGTIIHAQSRCKGWRVIERYWYDHGGEGLL